jgi:ribonuclease T
MNEGNQTLISVDIEASGPSPSIGSLLSIGACLVADPSVDFYVELKPIEGQVWDDHAETVHDLSREHLETNGLEPAIAMERFASWVEDVKGKGRAVFVGFNAPFDWMFVADYLWRYVGRNPFGVSALDLKSYFMGRNAIAEWQQTRRADVDRALGFDPDHNHHALDDAKGQARIAEVLLRPR